MSDLLSPVNLPPWAVMWGLSFAIYGMCKGLSWKVRTVTAPTWKHAAYLFAWPGMDADTFLAIRNEAISAPKRSEWGFALLKLGFGLGIVCGIVPVLTGRNALLVGWAGMVGIIFTLHFGLFHVLSCLWRRAGAAAIPIMNWPIVSQSVSEFWGRRWNLAFRDLTHRFLFHPLSRRLGPTGSLLAGFLLSGLVHDLVISWPAGGGYGWPTCYFIVQGMAIVVERSRWGRQLGLRRGLNGRLAGVCVIGLPSPLLLHSAFVCHVIVPFLTAIGVVS